MPSLYLRFIQTQYFCYPAKLPVSGTRLLRSQPMTIETHANSRWYGEPNENSVFDLASRFKSSVR